MAKRVVSNARVGLAASWLGDSHITKVFQCELLREAVSCNKVTRVDVVL